VADPVASVRHGYDRWAAIYESDANPLPPLETPVVRAAIGDVRGQSVLDLGCGTGRHTTWLVDAGASVTAVDFSEGMLAEARRKPGMESVRFIVHDLHQPLPLSSNSFDLVLSSLVLEHLRDLENFYAEVARVLKPRGKAVVSAMHPAMFLRGSQARFTDPVSGELVQPGSIAHALGTLVMAALKAGLDLVNIEELAPDADFGVKYPRAEKYIGWPMLVVFSMMRGAAR
jgi:ubiquinone/menaquinone biosynthesis C-methylase UbiE